MFVLIIPTLFFVLQSGCIRRRNGSIRIPLVNNHITVTDTCDGVSIQKSFLITASGKSRFSFCGDLRLIGRLIHSESGDGDVGEIGIGPQSDLVRKFGNVALFADELILGDSGRVSMYRSGCHEWSDLMIPIEDIGKEVVGSMGFVGTFDREVPIVIHGDIEFPFAVPNLELLTYKVKRKFPEVRFDAEGRFTCNDEIIGLLNGLEFHFRTALLRIESTQYVERIGEVCRLKVRETRNMAALNPLAIPDKNFRISKDAIHLCDRAQPQIL